MEISEAMKRMTQAAVQKCMKDYPKGPPKCDQKKDAKYDKRSGKCVLVDMSEAEFKHRSEAIIKEMEEKQRTLGNPMGGQGLPGLGTPGAGSQVNYNGLEAASQGHNPFSRTGNPYGPSGNPYGPSSNPFGGQNIGANSNPWGKSGQNPWGQPGQNPFGASGNPWGQSGKNSYGSSGNPWGQQGQNPFGASQNPWGQQGYGPTGGFQGARQPMLNEGFGGFGRENSWAGPQGYDRKAHSFDKDPFNQWSNKSLFDGARDTWGGNGGRNSGMATESNWAHEELRFGKKPGAHQSWR
jgi:hypothetical protein